MIEKIASYIYRKLKTVALRCYYEITNKFSSKYGLSEKKRNPEIIINLTSFPKRFGILHLTLETLLNQKVKPDRLILWISKEEAKNDSELPNKIAKLKQRGLEIEYVEGNTRSYKKLVYSLEKFPNAIHITVDDDTLYPRDFLEGIYLKHKVNKENIVAYRCSYVRKINEKELAPYIEWEQVVMNESSFNLFPTGVGGVLYPPGSLNKDVVKKELFLELCPLADDIWFKAMGLLNGTKTIMVGDTSKSFLPIKSAQKSSLWRENVGNNKNDEQLKKVFDYYNLYKHLE